jgi:hypothetical protein
VRTCSTTSRRRLVAAGVGQRLGPPGPHPFDGGQGWRCPARRRGRPTTNPGRRWRPGRPAIPPTATRTARSGWPPTPLPVIPAPERPCVRDRGKRARLLAGSCWRGAAMTELHDLSYLAPVEVRAEVNSAVTVLESSGRRSPRRWGSWIRRPRWSGRRCTWPRSLTGMAAGQTHERDRPWLGGGLSAGLHLGSSWELPANLTP